MITIDSPQSLLAAVPQLVAFHPADSMVVIGTGPGGMRVTLRYDLPTPAEEVTLHLARVFGKQDITAAAAAGYGPAALVDPVASAVRRGTARTGVWLAELIRADEGLYWNYLCSDPECCLPGGTPFTAEIPPGPDGRSRPVLSSREDLAAMIAPAAGKDADVMAAATRAAEKRASALAAAGGAMLTAAGVTAVEEAIGRCRRGDRTRAGDDAAWLTVLLRDLRVRDDAWCRMDPGYRKEHGLLWTDILRLARPGYIAAPASLLAVTAWQCGNGALANIALDRAQEDSPGYLLARLLREAVSERPPQDARPPMAPGESARRFGEARAGRGIPGISATPAERQAFPGAGTIIGPQEARRASDPRAGLRPARPGTRPGSGRRNPRR